MAPVLEFAVHVLDLVALAVESLVMGYLDFSVLFRWDAGVIVAICKRIAEPVGIVALVAPERLRRWQRREQCRGTGVIANLARRQKQLAGTTLIVADRVQLLTCLPEVPSV
jgi:hypothetical protein